MSDSKLTIRVYEVKGSTGERVELPAVDPHIPALRPRDPALLDYDRWPPCQCPLHAGAPQSGP